MVTRTKNENEQSCAHIFLKTGLNLAINHAVVRPIGRQKKQTKIDCARENILRKAKIEGITMTL